MIISDIQQGVIDLWEFLVPRVSILLIMGVITYYILGYSHVKRLKNFSLYLHHLENKEIKEALKFYGVDKLMPLITLFLIMLFLHASFTIFNGVGHMLPPQLSFDLAGPFLESDHGELARIWATNPNIQNFDDLCMFIKQTTEFEENESLRMLWGIEYWQNEINHRYSRFNSIKFLIFWTFLLLILSLKTVPVRPYPLAKFLVIFVILFLLGIFSILHFFYAVQQLASAELAGADMKVGAMTENATEDWRNSIEKFEQKVELESEYREGKHWWKIEISGKYFYRYWWKIGTNNEYFL
ncbi:MAG: hypothetical protein AB9861_20305 [Methanosarcina sp.]|jgi:hypothetical protein